MLISIMSSSINKQFMQIPNSGERDELDKYKGGLKIELQLRLLG